MRSCIVKLDEEKSKCAGLAQQNFTLWVGWQKAQQLLYTCRKEEYNTYMI
jgi:hypothetical protein